MTLFRTTSDFSRLAVITTDFDHRLAFHLVGPDNQVLQLSGEFARLVDPLPDLSKLAVITRDENGQALHLIGPDEIKTVFEKVPDLTVENYSPNLDWLLVQTRDENNKASLHFVTNDGRRQTIRHQTDHISVIDVPTPPANPSRKHLLIAEHNGNTTSLHTYGFITSPISPLMPLYSSFEINRPLQRDSIVVEENDANMDKFIWTAKAADDGETELVYKNDQLLASGKRDHLILSNNDFSKILVYGEPAFISLNGQTLLDDEKLRIKHLDVNDQHTLVAVSLIKEDGTNYLFYLTPGGYGVLGPYDDTIWLDRLEVLDDRITAEIVRGGIKRGLVIKVKEADNPKAPATVIEETAA